MSDFATRALKEFYRICEIPHGSFHTQEMFAYLCSALESRGYTIATDSALNILARKGSPHICLQSHYDMVCVGRAARGLGVEPYTERDESGREWLRARDSSLGADNGIGMACMLALDSENIELLFTNDEEVGMLGANALDMPLHAPLLLNLDSERLGEITLGCAGGVDIACHFPLVKAESARYPYTYTLQSEGFLGGHSGIDIHKGRENAIVELVRLLSGQDTAFLSLEAGEKRNSIPVSVKCTLKSCTPLPPCHSMASGARFIIESIDSTESCALDFAPCYALTPFLESFARLKNGVHSASDDGVLASLNCSLLTLQNGVLRLDIMARANATSLLDLLIAHIESAFVDSQHAGTETMAHTPQKTEARENLADAKGRDESLEGKASEGKQGGNATIETSGFYAPWQRSIAPSHPALTTLRALYKQQDIEAREVQIHAGLECGILKQRLLSFAQTPRELEVLSIGPTIRAPHSCDERLDLEDFRQFCAVLENFINTYKGEK